MHDLHGKYQTLSSLTNYCQITRDTWGGRRRIANTSAYSHGCNTYYDALLTRLCFAALAPIPSPARPMATHGLHAGPVYGVC
eukprot:9447772-Pyramimonas_sp.AAC.1